MRDAMTETVNWCTTCGTQHRLTTLCPGDLPASAPERPGWTILARTPTGPARFQVLLAPCQDIWRARIRTFPNVLWLVPGGSASLKFAARRRLDAERKAIAFIEAHCEGKGYAMQREAASLWNDPEPIDDAQPARRKNRFLPIRFGLQGPSEQAGTGNLSETGMFVVTDSPVEPGTKIRLVLDIDRRPIPMMGQVRWNRTEFDTGGVPGMGVQLLEPPRPYLRYVRNL